MVYCPACEADMDVDEEQLQEGGVLNCDGCGVRVEVVNLHPLQLERLDDEDEDLDDDEDELDDDLDEEDEDEEEDEEDGYDEDEEDFGGDDEDEDQ